MDSYEKTVVEVAVVAFFVIVVIGIIRKYILVGSMTKKKTSQPLQEVPDFNEKEYTKQKFDLVMESMRTDASWTSNVTYDEINLSMGPVRAYFEYRFDGTPKIFKIRSATIATISSSNKIYGDVDDETMVFLYNKYCEYRNSNNLSKKIAIDEKLDKFNSILKSVNRDNKINDILN